MSKTDIPKRLREILESAQEVSTNHTRCTTDLTHLCQSNDATTVLKDYLIPLLSHLLVVFKREPTVERTITFVIQFACETSFQVDGLPFYTYLIKYLLPFTSSYKTGTKDQERVKAVRFRSTQIIAGILDGLSEDTEIIDDIWHTLEKNLLARALDKVPLIRIQAAIGLGRLQGVEDPDNETNKMYLQLLKADSSKEVRRAVLQRLVPTKHNLDAVLERCADVSPDVRIAAFQLIRNAVPIKALSILQRIQVIERGLKDRDPDVKAECMELCQSWLKSLNSSLPLFLKAFDVENTDDKLVELLIESMLEVTTIDEVDWRKQSWTCELMVLWRVWSLWNYKKGGSYVTKVEDCLPETLIEYCEMVSTIVVDHSSAYMLRNVVQLSHLLDKSDEAGRRAAVGLLSEVCSATFVEEKDIQYIAKAVHYFAFDLKDYLEKMSHAITCAREHIDAFEEPEKARLIQKQESRIVELKSEITRLERKLAKDLNAGDDLVEELAEAKQEKQELETYQTNRNSIIEWSWVRTMTIAENIFSYISSEDLRSKSDAPADVESPNDISSLIKRFGKEYLGNGLCSENTEVRKAAMRALGVLATADATRNSTQHLPLLFEALNNDETEVKSIALMIMFDLVALAGFEAMELKDPQAVVNSKNHVYKPIKSDFGPVEYPYSFPDTNIFSLLLHYLRSAQEEALKTVAVEGWTKLFTCRRIMDPITLSELFIQLFDPKNSDNNVLQQSLSLFLPVFSYAHMDNQNLVLASFVPTLRRLLHASPDTSLANAHVESFLKFISQLTDIEKFNEMHPDDEISEQQNLTNELLILTLVELLTTPLSVKGRTLSKLFTWTYPLNEQEKTIRKVEFLSNLALSVLSKLESNDEYDPITVKNITNFSQSIKPSNEIPPLTVDQCKELEAQVEKATLEIEAISGTSSSSTSKQLKRSKSSTSVDSDNSSTSKGGRKLMSRSATKKSLASSSSSSQLDQIDEVNDELELVVTSRAAKKAASSIQLRTSSSIEISDCDSSTTEAVTNESTSDLNPEDENTLMKSSSSITASKEVPIELNKSSEDIDEEEEYVAPLPAKRTGRGRPKATASSSKASEKVSSEENIPENESNVTESVAHKPRKRTASASSRRVVSK